MIFSRKGGFCLLEVWMPKDKKKKASLRAGSTQLLLLLLSYKRTNWKTKNLCCFKVRLLLCLSPFTSHSWANLFLRLSSSSGPIIILLAPLFNASSLSTFKVGCFAFLLLFSHAFVYFLCSPHNQMRGHVNGAIMCQHMELAYTSPLA